MPPTDFPAARESCNCHWPIGLVVFLFFTILSLFICTCVCCFDVSSCVIFKKKDGYRERKHSIDPRYLDSTKFFERKLSLDPRILEYSHLLNSGSLSSSQSRSVDLCSNTMYSTDGSMITSV